MGPNDISIEKIFLILRLRIWLILAVFGGAVLVAALYTYQMPKMYMATASLNFDFSGNNPLDERGRTVLSQDSYLTTQVGVLQSLNVAQQVVDSLSDYERVRVIAALDASQSALDVASNRVMKFVKTLISGGDKEQQEPIVDVDGGAGSVPSKLQTLEVSSHYDWLARALGSDLVIYPQVNSRIVEVSYYSTDPKVAALLADRFAEAYIAANLKMVIDPARKTKVWFDDQLKLLRVRLEESQSRLTEYQQKEGIVSSDQRIDIETTHLRSLADQLVAAQQATRNAETEKKKLEEVLARGDTLATFGPVFSNPDVQKIKADIRNLEATLAEGSNSLGVNHPKIKKIKAEIVAAQSRLSREINSVVESIDNAADLSVERERSLEQAVADQKQLVLKLKSEHDKIQVLQRDVESAQVAYNAALGQLNTTSMQSMLNQTNVSVVDHATVPRIHATPRVTKNLALGAFGGLLLGIGTALFLELFGRKVHSENDIVDLLGIPLLGELRKFP